MQAFLFRQNLAKNHEILITVEDGSIGGFSAQVMSFLAKQGLLDNGLKFRPIFFPDKFINHGTQDELYKECYYNEAAIKESVYAMLKTSSVSKVG